MGHELARRLLRGILSFIFTAIAAWLAAYLTDKILGPAEEEAQA